ncbi:2-oxoglutarate ferredoxin oxidoreductase subunit beta [Hydrogenivirga caldilitoris]|uniref:2-oxoglutarate ferredoxin oxidoreductase subunit beta n=1 Tax=Hydrogenivirga caldilitoris TaxID=246264 RepID=A0A497XQM5_9AQUI|nr:thiamine pyrophosphate-dependent enzyme [Hydrogenivirga caldilitoris]RLJ70450.1 2-oxoglutarate ferredoxin oxidoreductase subunit beta [Hydrogenivirga caldilitoris]
MALAKRSLYTGAEITWCRLCGNFGLMSAFAWAVEELSESIPLEKFVVLSGIGCHGKIVDYINLNSFYSIHGRAPATATGIKLANPELYPVCFVGDGDIYAEGISHLLFAAKRNTDITVIVHDNRAYSLTTGQFTPTSPVIFRGKSTPEGPPEDPINPVALMLEAGATFVARGYAGYTDHLKEIIKQAILHKGFSFVDVLQPCVVFYNTYELYNRQVYKLESAGHDPSSYEEAYRRAKEWDYNREDVRIPIGVFYKTDKPTYEERV